MNLKQDKVNHSFQMDCFVRIFIHIVDENIYQYLNSNPKYTQAILKPRVA